MCSKSDTGLCNFLCLFTVLEIYDSSSHSAGEIFQLAKVHAAAVCTSGVLSRAALGFCLKNNSTPNC